MWDTVCTVVQSMTVTKLGRTEHHDCVFVWVRYRPLLSVLFTATANPERHPGGCTTGLVRFLNAYAIEVEGTRSRRLVVWLMTTCTTSLRSTSAGSSSRTRRAAVRATSHHRHRHSQHHQHPQPQLPAPIPPPPTTQPSCFLRSSANRRSRYDRRKGDGDVPACSKWPERVPRVY